MTSCYNRPWHKISRHCVHMQYWYRTSYMIKIIIMMKMMMMMMMMMMKMMMMMMMMMIIIIISLLLSLLLAHNRENDRSLFAIVIEIWRRLSAWQDYMCRSRQKWHNKEWNHVLKRYASCFEISPDQLPFYEYGFHVIVRELSPKNRLISYTF